MIISKDDLKICDMSIDLDIFNHRFNIGDDSSYKIYSYDLEKNLYKSIRVDTDNIIDFSFSELKRANWEIGVNDYSYDEYKEILLKIENFDYNPKNISQCLFEISYYAMTVFDTNNGVWYEYDNLDENDVAIICSYLSKIDSFNVSCETISNSYWKKGYAQEINKKSKIKVEFIKNDKTN